ncbi:hypothetical protein FD755_023528 [Muntiacus reevesi]|uniref:TEX10-like TPR repeats domain-containing protein n=1 Tax=Muntiacus reevesi TaxID=9886 RepID=A0A5N3VX51_MUNRE|nr:hypothetical protein FD755_023528 [Muntiacus reevesi]
MVCLKYFGCMPKNDGCLEEMHLKSAMSLNCCYFIKVTSVPTPPTSPIRLCSLSFIFCCLTMMYPGVVFFFIDFPWNSLFLLPVHRYSGREPLQVQLEVGIIYQSPHVCLALEIPSFLLGCAVLTHSLSQVPTLCDTMTVGHQAPLIKHCTILSNNVDHLLLNLTLSDIMVSLANASTLQKDSSWIERIRKFVTETLEDGSRLNSKQLNRLLGVSWRLMQMQSDREATESLIKAVYTLYQQRGLLLPVPTLLLKFFSKSYQKEELRSYRIRYRSKVLSRWLAGLPLQLAHLGSRNPELSTQFVDIIHTAAARANKELLKSLQVTALRIYDPQEGTVVVLSAESQQLLVQLVYFLPSLPADLLSRLSCCCIMGRLSANLAAMLIGILHMRSSFSGWKSSVKEWNGSDQLNISNEDYFSFLFSTLTGVPHVIQTQLSPVLLYLTDSDQFSHHWDITEYVVYQSYILNPKFPLNFKLMSFIYFFSFFPCIERYLPSRIVVVSFQIMLVGTFLAHSEVVFCASIFFFFLMIHKVLVGALKFSSQSIIYLLTYLTHLRIYLCIYGSMRSSPCTGFLQLQQVGITIWGCSSAFLNVFFWITSVSSQMIIYIFFWLLLL